MDQLFSGLFDFLERAKELQGMLSAAYSAPLDELCAALSAAADQPTLPAPLAAQVIQGLLVVQEIANSVIAAGLPAEPGGWTYTLQPAPLEAVTLTLQRLAPQPASLYAQLDSQHNLHGIFTLLVGSRADERLLSFDLEQRQDGWYLRRWENDRQVPFRLEVPAGKVVPWAASGSPDLWDQFLPASLTPGLGALLQSISSPRTVPVPKPVTSLHSQDQTLVSPHAVAALPALCLVNQQTGQQFSLKDRLTIGRSEESGLRLDDRELSRNHAVIEPLSGGWQIQDLNSTNGTWLNDIRLTGTAPLKAGDILRFGTTILRVESIDLPSTS